MLLLGAGFEPEMLRRAVSVHAGVEVKWFVPGGV